MTGALAAEIHAEASQAEWSNASMRVTPFSDFGVLQLTTDRSAMPVAKAITRFFLIFSKF